MLYLSGKVLPDVPAMLTPRTRQAPPIGQPWGADNGRFAAPQNYTDEGYLAWLDRMPRESCLFATAPDVVGDAAATLALSAPMLERIRNAGYPVALVAQDGLEHEAIPWDDFDALFIGGTTRWKVGEAAYGIAVEARSRGKWVHMGRVNSQRRWRVAEQFGCDSCDGTFLVFGPTVNRRHLDRWIRESHDAPNLWRWESPS